MGLSTKSISISIHALLAESDYSTTCEYLTAYPFLSTLSLRRATSTPPAAACDASTNFYPRSPCGERLVGASQGADIGHISIHALLAESDCGLCGPCGRQLHFYPRSPCGERRWSRIFSHPMSYFYPRSPCGERRKLPVWLLFKMAFLSTLSLRRATGGRVFFRTPCHISIHALLAESDQ